MGMFDFLKNAGEKVLDVIPGASGVKSLLDHLHRKGLQSKNVEVEYDPASAGVKVRGSAPNRAEAEKIAIALGNVQGVARVDTTALKVEHEPEAKAARFYTVKSGDSLSKIARSLYGDAKKHSHIFDANRPLLKDPDKIYPGQVLRIPDVA